MSASRLASSSRLLLTRSVQPASRLALPVSLARPGPSSFRSLTTAPSVSKRDAGEEGIHAKLAAKFPGKRLEVQDVSGGCGSFYAIEISSPAFNGLSTIKQHKLVNECLKEDIKGIHGLQLKTIPEEA
ncbi:bola protein [Dioszegia hungarica]|uniref:Bola protein n=1 Tax=Dioszegia hungarica TaxID=4972 RepID=A0AA38LXV4_9TREE|nr:bola protein [Dioszegia hungarica]KAI9637891.1 bola protein [Dioszegia hungarica]